MHPRLHLPHHRHGDQRRPLQARPDKTAAHEVHWTLLLLLLLLCVGVKAERYVVMLEVCVVERFACLAVLLGEAGMLVEALVPLVVRASHPCPACSPCQQGYPLTEPAPACCCRFPLLSPLLLVLLVLLVLLLVLVLVL